MLALLAGIAVMIVSAVCCSWRGGVQCMAQIMAEVAIIVAGLAVDVAGGRGLWTVQMWY